MVIVLYKFIHFLLVVWWGGELMPILFLVLVFTWEHGLYHLLQSRITLLPQAQDQI